MIQSFLGEALVDHSILTLIISWKAFGSPSRRSILERFKRIVPVDPRELETTISLAYVLHDIGKALSWYQERLRETKREERERPPGFKYHEIISAYIVNDILRRLGITSSKEVRSLTVTSVLLHHQAMRDLKKYLELSPFDELREILDHRPRIRPDDQLDIELLSLRLAQIIDDISADKIKDSMLISIDKLSTESLRGFLSSITYDVERLGRVFMLLPLVLVPLQMADNAAAAILRPNASPMSRLAYEVFRLIDGKYKLRRRIKGRRG